MKQTLVSLLSLLALSSLFTITSCQKEATGDGSQFRATMEGCTARDSKTTLSGTALNWVEGDQVAIYGTAGRGLYAATPQTPATTAVFDNVSGTTGDGPFRAFYPTSLTADGTTITLPATQTYEVNSIHEFPMYAESATNQLSFRNLCGVLKLHLTKANTNITSIAITANAPINGNFTGSNLNGEPVLTYVDGGSNTVVLSCATAQAIDNGKDFYITLPATFDSLKSIELTTDDGRYCTKTVKSNVCINVQRSSVTEITLGESDLNFVEPLPEGALPGLFSVSATQQVRFSQGNLQYQASTQTWRFAENQYDYVGADNANISATYSGWIDLFGWGTGNNPTLSSTSYSDYITFTDWGDNAIVNGGNAANSGWRTLSQAEWGYVFYSRPNASSKRGGGNVNGVHGEILLPDSWTLPDGFNFTPEQNGWSSNSYTLAQWAEMEAAGAVFLPAAGSRWGTYVSSVGRNGYYWSSTPHWFKTYSVMLNGYDLATAYETDNYGGLSVRPVRDNN